MTLTLEIITATADMPATRQRSFGEQGGKIGRDRGNDWVLPHNKVSGRHATITYRDGVFYIEDRSRNGVFLNSTTNRLTHGRLQPLQSGDCLFIEPYEIQVTVQEDSDSHALDVIVRDPFGAIPASAGSPVFPHRRAAAADEFSESGRGQEVVDPLQLIGGDAEMGNAMPAHQRDVPQLEAIDKGDPLAGHYQPPPVPVETPRPASSAANDAGIIPAGYDPIADTPSRVWPSPAKAARPAASAPPARPASEQSSPALDQGDTPPSGSAANPRDFSPGSAPVVEPPRTARKTQPIVETRSKRAPSTTPNAKAAPSAGTGESDLAAVLAAAGLGDVEVTPELAENFGQIFRVVVAGVMDILRARQQLKDEFRMRQTQFRPADNNPLKFSANVDDALHNLFVKRNPAYLGAAEAFSDAFDDLRDHQLAMVAGLRVAFESMLADFDAQRLQEQFDRQHKKIALVSVPAKMRYWDAYRERSEQLLKDVDATFRRWFGEEFVKAYEEQLDRLESERREREGR